MKKNDLVSANVVLNAFNKFCEAQQKANEEFKRALLDAAAGKSKTSSAKGSGNKSEDNPKGQKPQSKPQNKGNASSKKQTDFEAWNYISNVISSKGGLTDASTKTIMRIQGVDERACGRIAKSARVLGFKYNSKKCSLDMPMSDWNKVKASLKKQGVAIA